MLSELLKTNSLPGLWLVAVGIALAGFIASSAYWRSPPPLQSDTSHARVRLRVALRALGWISRFLATCTLLWMLLGWKQDRFETSEPRLLILVDSTDSMQLPAVASELARNQQASQNAFTTRWQMQLDWFRENRSTIERLSKDHQLMAYEIGDSLKWIKPGQQSLLDNVSQISETSPIGSSITRLLRVVQPEVTSAVVVFTDGNVNIGASLTNAAQLARDSNIPLFFVGVGRPNRSPDLRISNINVPEILFAGDTATMAVTVRRENTETDRCTLNLLDSESKVIATGRASFSDGSEYTEAKIDFEIQQPGRHDLTVKVKEMKSESDLSNNSSKVRVDVRDNTLKVLLVGQYPSYEFRFLKHLLQRALQRGDFGKPAFEVTTFLASSNKNYLQQDSSAVDVLPINAEQFSEYDAVVLMDTSPDLLPGSTQSSLVKHVRLNGAGLIAVAGPKNLPRKFVDSPLIDILPVSVTKLAESEWAGVSSTSFRWTPTSLGLSQQFLQLQQSNKQNELSVFAQLPANNWRAQHLTPVLPAAVFAVDDTDKTPLLLSRFVGAGRVAFQSTDETYRWRNFGGTNEIYDRYWIQLLRYVSIGRISANTTSSITIEEDQIEPNTSTHVTVDFANRIDEQQINLIAELKSTDDEQPTEKASTEIFALNRLAGRGSKFRGTVSFTQEGRWQLSVSSPDPDAEQDRLSLTKMINVSTIAPELMPIPPDEPEMRLAAEIGGGHFRWIDEADELIDLIPRKPPLKLRPVAPLPIWNNYWVLAIVVALISIDWVARRYLRFDS